MNKLKDSIEEAVSSRVKNPLLGFIFITWCLSNYEGIVVFLLSDTVEKVSIVRNYKVDLFFDVFIPILAAIFYVFIFPFFEIIQSYIQERIDTIKHKDRSNQLIKRYFEDEKSNKHKAVSDYEYIKDLKFSELERWKEERISYPKAVLELKEKYSTLESERKIEIERLYRKVEEFKSEVNGIENSYYNALDKLKGNNESLSDLISDFDKINNRYYIVRGDDGTLHPQLDTPSDFRSILEYSRSVDQLLSSIREKSEIFDPREDIPF